MFLITRPTAANKKNMQLAEELANVVSTLNAPVQTRVVGRNGPTQSY
jgi:hypothetical protein